MDVTAPLVLAAAMRKRFRAQPRPGRALAAAILLAALSVAAPPALGQSTQVLVSNVGQTGGIGQSINLTDSYAQRFTTGGNALGYGLSSIELRMRTSLLTPRAPTLQLRRGSATGTFVSGFTSPSVTTDTTANWAYTPTSTVTLRANTTYWVIITYLSPTNMEWNAVTSTTLDSGSAAGWSISAKGQRRPISATSFVDFSSRRFQLRVNGTNPSSAATGLPTITGTARVGETLTAAKGTIEDENGLPETFPDDYTFQWERVDGGASTDIEDATASTYTLVAADAGKEIRVKVSFSDDAGHPETVRSEATPTINTPATGAAAISGIARVGETLRATQGTIADADGLPTFPDDYTFQWARVVGGTPTNIPGAASQTYTPVAADEGEKISVTVSFVDNAGDEETLTSQAWPTGTGLIAPAPSLVSCTPSYSNELWCGVITVGNHYSEYSYEWVGGEYIETVDPASERERGYRRQYCVRRLGTPDAPTPQARSLGDTCYGSIDDAEFDVGGNTYGIQGVYHQVHAKGLTIEFTSAVDLAALNAFILTVNGVDYKVNEHQLRDRARGTNILWAVSLAGGAGWTVGDTIIARLRPPETTSEQVAADPPTVDGIPAVSEAGADGQWTAGETVEVTLTFDEAVAVDTTGGTPSVGLGLGDPTTARSATYARGSGETELVFSYTLTDADGSHSSMFVTLDSLALNGGTVRSVQSGADAKLTHNGTAVMGSSGGGAGGTRSGAPEATFENLPSGHDGTNGFTVELRFSGAPAGLTAADDAASVLEVTGGTVTGARSTSNEADAPWEVTIEPDGAGDVTVRVPARACTEPYAVCIGGQPLTEAVETMVPALQDVVPKESEPDDVLEDATTVLPAVSIEAPAATPVAEGTALAFTLRRTEATNEPLTVNVAVTETGDVLGADAPDSVTFAANSAEATLRVPTVDDATFEDASTVTATLSSGTDYEIGEDATAEAVVESDDLDPITAGFTQVPDEHDGSSPFVVQFEFSHEMDGYSYKTVQGGLFVVTGGTIEKANRLAAPSNLGWEIRVRPNGQSPVTLVARATTDCAAEYAACDTDGRKFDGVLETTVQGPPQRSVADATVDEAQGATFVVTLSRALTEGGAPVTVTATVDEPAPATGLTVMLTTGGTATLDTDYTLSSTTITLAAGETAGTATITVTDDSEDDDGETIVLAAASTTPALTAEPLTLTIEDNDATPVPALPLSGAVGLALLLLGAASRELRARGR